MELVHQKNRAALEALYDRYVRLVYSFAFKATGDEQAARSIVQAVYLRLWTTEKRYDPDKGQFVNWLLTVTRNITVDHLRREKRNQAAVPLEPSAWETVPDRAENGPEQIVFGRLAVDRVKQAYRHLTEAQVELLRRLYWEGYSLREIAHMRNEPVGTVKSRLYQALKVLRNHLAVEMEE